MGRWGKSGAACDASFKAEAVAGDHRVAPEVRLDFPAKKTQNVTSRELNAN